MKEIRTKVCKKANAYIKSGMNRSAAFKRAWSETYVKAANLQNGDKIMVTTYFQSLAGNGYCTRDRDLC
jgi:hypothetical protein